MKKLIAFLTAYSIAVCAFSQTAYYTVSGKIVDANTQLPMQAASVFAQNTTMGTVTDAGGNFSLQLPNGGYDLVITYTGYQTETKRVTTTDDKTISIALKQKEKAMEDVIIRSTGEVKDGWEKYGDFFMENFIGKTANSTGCTIKNREAVKFYFSKKRNRLKVLAEMPVEIENEALGYHIKYALDSFTYEYNTQVSVYTGYPLFEEMTPATEQQKLKWYSNRRLAYQGSVLHFMRSLFNKQLKEQGFEIQFLISDSNKDTAITLKNFYAAVNYQKNDSTQTVEILPNQTSVAVIYTALPEQGYLLANPGEPEKFQLSVFSFTPGEPVTIELNGYYFEQSSVIINQYLGWKKMADMLPYDFMYN